MQLRNEYMASTWTSYQLDCLFTRKETICDQLIELIKSIQSVSEFVSFECASKAEEQKSGYCNLVSWKTTCRNMSIQCPFWKEDDICGA